MEVIGLDIGFGYTKCTNGSRFLVFKSVYGGAIEPQFREQLITEGTEDDYLHFEVDGRGYFVGELAGFTRGPEWNVGVEKKLHGDEAPRASGMSGGRSSKSSSTLTCPEGVPVADVARRPCRAR